MTLPADRVNLLTNPSCETNTTGWSVLTNATVTSSTTWAKYGTASLRIAVTATGAFAVATAAGTSGIAVTANTAYTFSAYIYVPSSGRACTPQIIWYTSAGAVISTSSGTAVTDTSAGPRVYVTATSPGTAAYAAVKLSYVSDTAGSYHYADGMMFEKSSTLGTYIDGDQVPDSDYYYMWDGTANASTSRAQYRGVWVEVLTGPPCPRVQITVAGLGTVPGTVLVTRTEVDNGDVGTVPGWAARSVVGSDTDPDYAVPLGRDVTYTMFFNGQQINQMTVNVPSTSGYVQDPYDPSSAMPINVTHTDDGTLSLAAGSFTSTTATSNASKALVMGSRHHYSVSGQRVQDTGFQIMLNAWQNDTSDQFKRMTNGTVLLFRPLPSWGSMPGLMYTDAPVTELPVNRGRVEGNKALTQWSISGDVCTPVSRAPITGRITNDDMQTALAGTTYNTIKGRSGSKRYIDIKADPLSL